MLDNILIHYQQLYALILIIYLIFNNKKPILNWIIAFLIFIVFNLLTILLLIYFQFKIWYFHPISRFLLPPYTSITYFISYTYFHFYKEFIWSLMGGFFAFLIMLITNNIFNKTLFYPDEFIKVPILSSFLTFPFNFLFFISGLFLILIIQLFNLVKDKKMIKEKVSIKDFWVFIALFFIIFNIYFKMNPPKLFFEFMP